MNGTATSVEAAPGGVDRVVHELKRPYVAVFAILGLVTLFELNIPAFADWLLASFAIDLSRNAQYALLMATAIAKALLVALYYMHLRYESRALRLIPVVPLLFVVLLVLTVMLD